MSIISETFSDFRTTDTQMRQLKYIFCKHIYSFYNISSPSPRGALTLNCASMTLLVSFKKFRLKRRKYRANLEIRQKKCQKCKEFVPHTAFYKQCNRQTTVLRLQLTSRTLKQKVWQQLERHWFMKEKQCSTNKAKRQINML